MSRVSKPNRTGTPPARTRSRNAAAGSSPRTTAAGAPAALAPAELLRAIVDSSDDAIISKNLEGVITSWNKGAERLFGYSAEEAIGQPISMLFPRDRLGEEPRILEQLKRGERVDHFETIRLRKDGTPLNISLTISPVRDADGRIVGASKVARDITERKRIEAEIEKYRLHLEHLVDERTAELALSHRRLRSAERLSSIGTLSAGLGHDIGNVMMPLSAHVKALQAKLGVTATLMSEHFDAIHRSIEYLQSLSNGLRLLSIDPDSTVHTSGDLDLRQWWSQTEPLLKTTLTRQITLEHDFAPDLPPLAIPEHLLTQAVFNIVQNAAQAIASTMPRAGLSGRIRIQAAPAGDADGMVRLSVCDNGPGMSSQVRDRCLEPFFTTRTRGISTGLGLAVVHGIVQNARGVLTIESTPGDGSCFTLLLPAAAARRKPRDEPQKVAIVDVADPRLHAMVAYELSALNVTMTHVNGEPPPSAQLLIVDRDQQRAGAVAEFLQRQPDGLVVVVGEEPATPASQRIINVGPGIRREALRRALHRAVGEA